MIDLVTRNDRCFEFLETPHHFLTVSDLSVQAFHFVVIVVSCESDLSNVVRCPVESHNRRMRERLGVTEKTLQA